MDDRIDRVISELEKVAADAKDTFGAFSNERLNWRPSEKGWSVGQCLDHIIKSNEAFDPQMEKLVSGTRKNSFWENVSPFTGWGGRFLIKAVSDDSKKAKAPSKKIVPPSNIETDIVERFERHLDAVAGKVAACSSVDRKKTIVTSPFLAIFTYSLDDALTVLVEHTKRHIRQAKRVTDAEGFPAAACEQAQSA
jgi:hypothetical protein